MIAVMAALGVLLLAGAGSSTWDFYRWEEELADSLRMELGVPPSPEMVRGVRTIVGHPAIGNPNMGRVATGESPEVPNEFIDVGCLSKAIGRAAQSVGYADAERSVSALAKEVEEGKLSGLAFWEHIWSCRDFCSVMMGDMLKCYAKNEAAQFHRLVLFDYADDSYKVVTDGGWWSQGREYGNEPEIAAAVGYIGNNPETLVLVVGRASRPGDKHINRDLSGSRAETVAAELVGRGVSPDRINLRWFGEEPLHLTESWADVYGYRELFSRYGETGLNQSAMIVVYTPRSSR